MGFAKLQSKKQLSGRRNGAGYRCATGTVEHTPVLISVAGTDVLNVEDVP